MKKQTYKMIFAGAAFIFIFVLNALPSFSAPPALLDPNTVTKFQDPLYIMPWMQPIDPANPTAYHVGMYPIEQQYHKDFPVKTKMWGYGRDQASAHSPANTFLAIRGVPITVNWTNNLVNPDGTFIVHPIDIDQTIPWADPLGTGPQMTRYDGPIPTVVHLHGGEVKSEADGHYSAWFTPDCINAPTIHGPSYDCVGQTYTYENEQQAALIWYHDHAFGIDRINVMMGLFGGYAIVDLNDPLEFGPNHKVPVGDAYDVPLVIQDRKIDVNYQIAYQGDPTNPDIHPIWFPEFFGNFIVVNGNIWPYKDVEARKYRFRTLNGSNARFYHLYLSDGQMLDANNQITLDPAQFVRYNPINLPFLHIASDGGFLNNAVSMTDFMSAPGERIEFIVDFTGMSGHSVYLVNDAVAPFPSGDPVDVNTGMIMKFNIVDKNSDDSYITLQDGSPLTPVPTLPQTNIVHNVVLFEKEGPGGPLAMFLDGVDMSDPRSIYRPVIGTTEIWNVINTTMDYHPMHWHLTQLQFLSRQDFRCYLPDMSIDPTGYLQAYKDANPILPIPYDSPINTVPISSYLVPGTIAGPLGNEIGAWKDTWECPPGVMTTLVTRWTQSDGSDYNFDPSQGPGYVFHCHILEHEENAMMREIHLERATPVLPTATNVLHLDGHTYQAYGPVNYTNMMPMLNHWDDISGLGNNAIQPVMARQPMHDGYGLFCQQGAMFMSSPLYGISDFFAIPYSGAVTSTNPNPLTPVADSKSIFVVFKPMMLMPGMRQTVFEAGGQTSGYNMFIDGSNLVFGMWNRLERKFVELTSSPLTEGQVYIASLEYDGATQKFRASLNGTNTSSLISFGGLSADNSPSGVAGEVGGTRYYDYAIGNDFANNFDGDIGDVLVYNSFDPALSTGVLAFMSHRYNHTWTYTPNPLLKDGWKVYEEYDNPTTNSISAAYPNPFNDKAQFTLNLAQKQWVNVDLYNSLGEKVANIHNGTLNAGSNPFTIDGASLTQGVYVVKVSGDGLSAETKVVFVK